MTRTAKISGALGVIAIAALLLTASIGAQSVPTSPPYTSHPAVGSWFGQAIQVCPSGVAPSACATGATPANTLFMTPSILPDGLFIADDSFTLLAPPYGPHMTAHGMWYPTGTTTFTAEYVFVTRTFPPDTTTLSGVRCRWSGEALDANTLRGWVNVYGFGPWPMKWVPRLPDEFPVLPPETAGMYTPPDGFITDPSLCRTAGCPQVFKFTLKRITK